MSKKEDIQESKTAVRASHNNSVPASKGKSIRYERFGLQEFYNRLGKPNFQMKLWDGFTVGPAENTLGTVKFNNRSVLYKLLFSGEVAFGDGYSNGTIDVEGNLVDMLVESNVSRHKTMGSNRNGIGTPFEKLSLARVRPSNTLGRAQENIHHHYDIGNEFYQLWLDTEMQYTCAYFPYQDMTLEEAQQAKMDHVCRKLQLKSGDKVVEAGCGWGGLARHMAKYYDVRVTSYNISKEQIRFASDRARAEGYDDRVNYIEDDYRNMKGSYDVFVSVGMLEHVGKDNYNTLGNIVASNLKSDGRALIHSIGRNVARPMSAWIDKRIFPGAYPPTLREIMNILEPNRFSVLDVENLRLHYARTLEHWLDRFESSNLEVSSMFDEKFIRAWRLYLSGSIAAFLTGGLQLFQVVFSGERNNQIPWSREHLY